jgi:RimJ/RimL family protein N-acetyltransferase
MSEDAQPLVHVSLPAGSWTLVPPEPAHAPAALRMLTDPDVEQWHPASVVDLDGARAWIARSAAWSSEFAVWSIVDQAAHFVGNCMLVRIDRDDQKHATVGYRTAPWARGEGVATAAVIAIAAWAFDQLGLERLELLHVVANPASCAVARKAGFTLEGVLRQQYRATDGSRWDSHLHSLLFSDV